MMRIIELLKVLVSGCRAYLSCFKHTAQDPALRQQQGETGHRERRFQQP
jgi:hypothetical protein